MNLPINLFYGVLINFKGMFDGQITGARHKPSNYRLLQRIHVEKFQSLWEFIEVQKNIRRTHAKRGDLRLDYLLECRFDSVQIQLDFCLTSA